ncbi:hypothetical protein NFHSH190041_17660 [Shewanella sp. NFH-SH190041]|uniref:DUF1329 domain-containing protein n=1 Tax=Shewanella sp. NFH-SH190041 TaxID=2950245 RepID=UPI0021C3418D|nr:DUF1329 domain-containing protein [Shewanella sp. NFH-SH190041]BDM64314.1 hypothetical protein NFHSH190041_17660 [Shewanella sp. NFH-SH190041]
MRNRHLLTPLLTAMLVSVSGAAFAKVSQEQADKLGNELTCVGAIAAGNKAGTIPPFSGKWLGTPEHIKYEKHVGQHPVDPYPDDKPLYTISGKNYQQYKDKLTPGQIAMFERYPATFTMPVYEGRRDFRYPDVICDTTKRNALEAELIDEGFGFTGYKGTVPFPIPDLNQPMQVLANHNFPYRPYTYATLRDIADVSSSGKISWGRANNTGLNVPNHPEHIGKPAGGVMAYGLTATLLPTRNKGSATVSTEPMNFARDKRLAWNYNPGTRRVRQLPEYGFDTPMAGTSGKLTIDSDRLMNGSPERYDWTVQDRREIFIPANAYKIHLQDVSYDALLTVNHANPEFMRYELRRVWVLEGKLKDEYRHKYGRRTMYLDEDNWHAVIGDFYDTRDELVQHALINYYYAYDADSYEAGTSFYHDLKTGSYIGYNLFQERKKGPVLNKGDFRANQFTPAALRRMSH